MRNLNAEGAAAAAGALHVRVVELEARTFDGFDVVDLDAVEVHLAHLIDEDFEAVEFVHVVAIFVHGIFKGHVVAEARATAADDGYAQAYGRGILLGQDFLHFRYRYRRHLNHSQSSKIAGCELETRLTCSVYQIPTGQNRLKMGRLVAILALWGDCNRNGRLNLRRQRVYIARRFS